MKNGGKTISVAFIILVSVNITKNYNITLMNERIAKRSMHIENVLFMMTFIFLKHILIF